MQHQRQLQRFSVGDTAQHAGETASRAAAASFRNGDSRIDDRRAGKQRVAVVQCEPQRRVGDRDHDVDAPASIFRSDVIGERCRGHVRGERRRIRGTPRSSRSECRDPTPGQPEWTRSPPGRSESLPNPNESPARFDEHAPEPRPLAASTLTRGTRARWQAAGAQELAASSQNDTLKAS